MKFNKEFSSTDVIAFFVVIISCFSLWKSFQSNEAFIVSAGADQISNIEFDGQCHYLLSIPVQFHNAGGEAVKLLKYVPAELPTAIFVKKIDRETKEPIVSYKVYKESDGTKLAYGWLKHLKNLPEFSPENQYFLDKLIKPGETYATNFIFDIQPYSNNELLADSIAISFDAVFSNGQKLSINNMSNIQPFNKRVCGT